MSDQEKDLGKIESAALSEEFVPTQTQQIVPVVPPSQGSLQIAGYAIMGITTVFGLLAQKRGGHWLLSESDVAQLHMAIARVAEKYIKIDQESPIIQLAAVAGAILLPRLGLEMMERKGAANGDQPEHQVAQ